MAPFSQVQLSLRYDREVNEVVGYSALVLREMLVRGDLSSTEVVTAFLERIDGLNPQIGAFCRVDAERALETAREHDRDRTRQMDALLWSLPIGDKDLSEREGIPTGHGSRAGGEIATESSPEVRALDAAGAISLGRTTASEFGLYGYTSPAAGPIVRNPLDLTLGAGGSSGGAAAAVASNMLPFAPGSDGGGSIRIPAASVGIVGVKPSREFLSIDRGAAATTGLVSGALARSVADAALLLDAMTVDAHPRIFSNALNTPAKVLRVGFTDQSPWHAEYQISLNESANEAVHLAVTALGELCDCEVSDDVRFPNMSYTQLFKTAWQRAAASVDPHFDLALMEPVTRQQILAGRALSADEIQRNRDGLRTYGDELAELLERFDVVVTPTLGKQLHSSEGWSDDADENFDQQVRMSPYSSWVNVAGLPAITLPTRVSVTSAGGSPIPVSIQLIGRRGQDLSLIAMAAQLEPCIR